jgi:DNA-binding transcriptional LysR family regulator
MQVNNWTDLRFLLALHRRGTLTAAATDLKVDQTTVTRRLRALEKAAGGPLFERLRGGAVFTHLGEEMVQTAIRLEVEILDLEARVLGGQSHMEGPVRLTMPVIYAVEFAQECRDFARAYPDIELEVVGADGNRSISKRDVDIALRVVTETGPPEDLVGRKISKSAAAIYGAPALLDLPWEQRPWLGRIDSFAGWNIIDRYRQQLGSGPWAFKTNDGWSVQQAAREGAGVTLFPCGCPRLTEGLVTMTRPEVFGDVWLLTHPELRQNPRMRATMDYWYAVLERHGPAMAGLDEPTPAWKPA